MCVFVFVFSFWLLSFCFYNSFWDFLSPWHHSVNIILSYCFLGEKKVGRLCSQPCGSYGKTKGDGQLTEELKKYIEWWCFKKWFGDYLLQHCQGFLKIQNIELNPRSRECIETFSFLMTIQTLTITANLWTNSMKCDISSPSPEICMINNKTTSIKFGKKRKKNARHHCILKQFHPNEAYSPTFPANLSFEPKSEYCRKRKARDEHLD